MRYAVGICIIVITSFLAACGGGGGGGQPGSSTTKATFKISTAPLQGSVVAGGVDMVITIPVGITIPYDAVTGKVQADRIVFSGVNAAATLNTGTYIPGQGTASPILRLVLVNANGIATGDLLSVTCDITPGYTPVASAFSIVSFSAFDLNGSPITGLTPSLEVAVK